jgi:hypothetical protein
VQNLNENQKETVKDLLKAFIFQKEMKQKLVYKKPGRSFGFCQIIWDGEKKKKMSQADVGKRLVLMAMLLAAMKEMK